MDRLSETNDKIIAVAYDAGFESLRTFNRIFLRISGMTPLEYRERNKENMEP
jgi:AraC-like DNA-binding protein